MGLRHKSIRLRVLLLVLIPVLSLIGVYAFATTITASAAVSLTRAKAVKNVTAVPAGQLQTELDAERRLALLYLADPTGRALTQLDLQESITNHAVKLFEGTDMSGSLTANASAGEKAAAAQLVKATRTLPALRARVAADDISRPAVLNQYSAMVTAGYRVLEGAIQQYDNVPLVMESLNLIKLDEVDQIVLQESDLFASDLAARSFPAADRAEFTELVAVRQYLLADTLPQLSSADRAIYNKYVPAQSAAALTQLENTIIHAPAVRGLPPVQELPWVSTVTAYSTGLGKGLTQAADAATTRAQAEANATYLRLILAGGLGLLAIIASILFSLLIGRGLVRQLGELRQSALELANDRLPSVMQRLRDGQSVDVAAESPPVESSADEIDQVRQAFNVVQRTAIEAAVDEANLRRGVSDVFRNLARRSQVLLHRQLRLLDGMERRASEPEELEDLFRIDHLTTRMRRHAEGLIILSGESPGRSWRHPVPLVDVLRAAVAEVEDYTRIRVEARTRAALAGAAVADVIHLVAELAENATVFSPPNTPVRIQGDIVGRGFAVEIEDRGLGIAEERMAEINHNLSSPPVFDLSGSDRLGLFIAGRLAARHDIKITLRPSPYGGTTAIVVIPLNLIVDEGSYEHVPSIGADGRGLPLGGRHAALSESRAALSESRAALGESRAALGSSRGPSGATPPEVNGQLPAEAASFWTRAVRPAGPAPPVTGSPVAALPATGLPTGPARRQTAPAPVTSLPGGNGADWPSQVPWTQPVLTGADLAEPATDGGDPDSRDDAPDPADLGLPVRVRQASLAPQLRDAKRQEDGEPPQASPDAARNTMAALQRGWQLGRSVSDEPPADAGADAAADGESALDGADQ
jgi:signal transduction histidine kinase